MQSYGDFRTEEIAQVWYFCETSVVFLPKRGRKRAALPPEEPRGSCRKLKGM